MDRAVIRRWIEHFLPRDVVGPVIIVFSLEGVVDGVFGLYVEPEHATLGWGLVFLASLLLVSWWGATDEEGLEELEEDLAGMREEAADA